MVDLAVNELTIVALPEQTPHIKTLPPRVGMAAVVPVPGPRGPRGVDGFSASEVFTHLQATPASAWIIHHPADRPVSSLTVLINGEEVIADVAHAGTTAVITFAVPVAGSARYI